MQEVFTRALRLLQQQVHCLPQKTVRAMQSIVPHNSADGAAFALHHPSAQFPLPGTRLSVCNLFCGQALNTEDSSGASTRHDTTYIVTGRPVNHVVACMAGIKVQLAVIPVSLSENTTHRHARRRYMHSDMGKYPLSLPSQL